MKVQELCKILDAEIATDKSRVTENSYCEFAFATDLMSDVLCLTCDNVALITGLCNIQTIRTAYMADLNLIILARGKKADSDMINLANENNIIICQTEYSVYKSSGLLFAHGLKPVF